MLNWRQRSAIVFSITQVLRQTWHCANQILELCQLLRVLVQQILRHFLCQLCVCAFWALHYSSVVFKVEKINLHLSELQSSEMSRKRPQHLSITLGQLSKLHLSFGMIGNGFKSWSIGSRSPMFPKHRWLLKHRKKKVLALRSPYTFTMGRQFTTWFVEKLFAGTRD